MGGRRPSAPSLQPCPPASSAAQRRSPDAMATQNELLGAAPCKGKLSSSSKPQPHRASVQKLNTSCFHPRPSALHRAKRGWAAPGSLGPALLLGVSGHSPRVLLRGQAGLGARRPSAPWAQPCPLNQLGRSALRSPRNGDPKRASWSCILQRETLLGSKPQPQRASTQESPAIRFRHRPTALHRAQLSWATPGSLGPAALLGVSCTRITLHTAESHSTRVLLRGEAGLGARRPSAPWSQPCPLSQLGRSA